MPQDLGRKPIVIEIVEWEIDPREKRGSFKGAIRSRLRSLSFFFNDLLFLRISFKSLKSLAFLFSIPTAPTKILFIDTSLCFFLRGPSAIQSLRHDRNRGFGRHFRRMCVFSAKLTCEFTCLGPRRLR